SGVFYGASYVSAVGDPNVVLTFSNAVAVGGGATYTVTSGGVATAVGGAGIVCIEAPVAPETDQSESFDLPAEEDVVTEEPVEQPADEGQDPAVDGDTGTED